MRCRIGATVCGAAMILSLAGCEGLRELARVPSPTNPAVEKEKSGTSSGANQEAPVRPPRKPDQPDGDGRKGTAVGAGMSAVMGGSEGDVTRFLGEPKAVRNEPPAMVWHYAVGSCKLDVFFYFDIGNKDFRALAYKFDPQQGTADAERTCVASIRNGKPR